MDRVDDIPEQDASPREDDDPAAHDELPTHGADQPDAEVPAPAEEAAPAEPLDLDALQAKAAEAAALADRLKRVEAEFVNEAKRIRRKAEEDRKYAIEKVVVDLLPVLDALHGARDALGEDEAAASMREGLALVEKQLAGVFERYGIAAIDAQGKPFDPARHQAMMMVERPDVEPQTVCEVMRLGYELHGRVVRPAEVIVARAPAAPADEEAPGEDADQHADGEDA